MRVRDHVVLSTATAALLYPRLGRAVFGAWAASILIDIDHYLWFAVRNRRLNPVAAVRSFNNGQAPQKSETRLLHHPAALLALLVLSSRRRTLLVPVLGMAFHVGLDAYHRTRTERAQTLALNRDRFTCQVCGVRSTDVLAHLWRQPFLLPSYRVENFVSVCSVCHQVAHEAGSRAIAGMNCDWGSYLRRTGLGARLKGARVRDPLGSPTS